MKAGRNYKLFIGTQDGETLTVTPPLTIQFNVSRQTLAQANTLSLQIYNLSESSRARIFQDRYIMRKYSPIVFMAGYNELTPIFTGNIFSCYSHREQGSPNIVTYIEAWDGGWDFVNSISSHTFAAGTSNLDIIKTLANDFTYINQGRIGDIPGYRKRGETLMGDTFDLLKTKSKNKFFVDMGKLNILGLNEALAGEVPLIESDTGLLGTPRREATYLSIDTIFEPRITVAQVIEVKSSVQKQFDGQFKVVGVTHAGMISEAQNGQCISTFNLLMGNQLQNAVTGGVSTFNIINDNNTNVDDVYNYLEKYGQPPKTNITPDFKWSELLVNYTKQGAVPSKTVLLNLVQTANRLQEIKNKYFPGREIKIISGWRSASYNATLKTAAHNSLHIQGKAADISVEGLSPREVQLKLNWGNYNGGLEYADTHTHIDIGANRRFAADL